MHFRSSFARVLLTSQAILVSFPVSPLTCPQSVAIIRNAHEPDQAQLMCAYDQCGVQDTAVCARTKTSVLVRAHKARSKRDVLEFDSVHLRLVI